MKERLATALERQLAPSIIVLENDEHAAETIAKIEALASELLTVRTNFGTLLTGLFKRSVPLLKIFHCWLF